MAAQGQGMFQGKLPNGSYRRIPSIIELKDAYYGPPEDLATTSIPLIDSCINTCADSRPIAWLADMYSLGVDSITRQHTIGAEKEVLLVNAFAVTVAVTISPTAGRVATTIMMLMFCCLHWNWSLKFHTKGMLDVARMVGGPVAANVEARCGNVDIAFGSVLITCSCLMMYFAALVIHNKAQVMLLLSAFYCLYDIAVYLESARAVGTEIKSYRLQQKFRTQMHESDLRAQKAEKKLENLRLMPEPGYAANERIADMVVATNKVIDQHEAEKTMLCNRNRNLRSKIKDLKTAVRYWNQHNEQIKLGIQRNHDLHSADKDMINLLRSRNAVLEDDKRRSSSDSSNHFRHQTQWQNKEKTLCDANDALRRQLSEKIELAKRIAGIGMRAREQLTKEQRVITDLKKKLAESEEQAAENGELLGKLLDQALKKDERILDMQEELDALQLANSLLEKAAVAREESIQNDAKTISKIHEMHQQVGVEGVAILKSLVLDKQSRNLAQARSPAQIMVKLQALRDETQQTQRDMSAIMAAMRLKSEAKDEVVDGQLAALEEARQTIESMDETIAGLRSRIAADSLEFDDEGLAEAATEDSDSEASSFGTLSETSGSSLGGETIDDLSWSDVEDDTAEAANGMPEA